MRRLGIAAIVCLFGLGGAAYAKPECKGERMSHPSKISVCMPNGWVKEAKPPVLKIKNAKDWTISLRMEPVEEGDLDHALKVLDKKIEDLVQVAWDKPTQVGKDDPKNTNHMDLVMVSGPGKRKDTNAEVQVLAAIVKTPTGKIVLVSLIVNKTALSTDGSTVAALLDSIQPTE
jgi:hypothetical protein